MSIKRSKNVKKIDRTDKIDRINRIKRLDDEAQWIVMMGFIVSVGIFFLAIILNQSILVGQTTSEAVLEFPKSEIQDLRAEIMDLAQSSQSASEINLKKQAMQKLALERSNAIIDFSIEEMLPINPMQNFEGNYNYTEIRIHYNNGVTVYDEEYLLLRKKNV